jgi:hypothetical protein
VTAVTPPWGTNRDFVATASDPDNLGSNKVVDTILNFGYRDDVRNLLTNSIYTSWGQPSRSQRVAHLISKDGVWNGLTRAFDPGYADMACSVDYIPSHDVADAPRLMNVQLVPMLQTACLGDGGIDNVKSAVDGLDSSTKRHASDECRLRSSVFSARSRFL